MAGRVPFGTAVRRVVAWPSAAVTTRVTLSPSKVIFCVAGAVGIAEPSPRVSVCWYEATDPSLLSVITYLSTVVTGEWPTRVPSILSPDFVKRSTVMVSAPSRTRKPRVCESAGPASTTSATEARTLARNTDEVMGETGIGVTGGGRAAWHCHQSTRKEVAIRSDSGKAARCAGDSDAEGLPRPPRCRARAQALRAAARNGDARIARGHEQVVAQDVRRRHRHHEAGPPIQRRVPAGHRILGDGVRDGTAGRDPPRVPRRVQRRRALVLCAHRALSRGIPEALESACVPERGMGCRRHGDGARDDADVPRANQEDGGGEVGP